MKRTVLAAVAGVLVALAIVGGFMALDRTVLHWYVESDEPIPTPVPTRVLPAFTESDVVRLAQPQIFVFPSDTNWIRCVNASFRQGNRMWVVTCEFRVNRDDANPAQTRTYLFDDRTGDLVR